MPAFSESVSNLSTPQKACLWPVSTKITSFVRTPVQKCPLCCDGFVIATMALWCYTFLLTT
jgi:hypothetical protein